MQKTFRDRLLEEIDRQGLTLADVARKAGVSYDQLKKLRQRPVASTNIDDARKIIAALGLTVDQFFEEEVEAQVRQAAEWLSLPEELRAKALAFAEGHQAAQADGLSTEE